MLGAVGLLLLVSLTLSTMLSLLASTAADRLPGADALWRVLNAVVSLALFAAVFAAIFRFLPDARIAWRDVVFGAVVTAVLFSIGKLLIGVYLGRQAVGSAYGAAGSLLVLLVWVYYSAMLVFFGAELTQSFASRRGRSILPDEHAVRESLDRARDPRERALVRDAIEAHEEAAHEAEKPS
jgi:membrane protein